MDYISKRENNMQSISITMGHTRAQPPPNPTRIQALRTKPRRGSPLPGKKFISVTGREQKGLERVWTHPKVGGRAPCLPKGPQQTGTHSPRTTKTKL